MEYFSEVQQKVAAFGGAPTCEAEEQATQPAFITAQTMLERFTTNSEHPPHVMAARKTAHSQAEALTPTPCKSEHLALPPNQKQLREAGAFKDTTLAAAASLDATVTTSAAVAVGPAAAAMSTADKTMLESVDGSELSREQAHRSTLPPCIINL